MTAFVTKISDEIYIGINTFAKPCFQTPETRTEF